MTLRTFGLMAGIIVAQALLGCASNYDAVKVGPDSYQVTATASPAHGGMRGAQQLATAGANKKCESLGKSVKVTNVAAVHDYPATDLAIVTFTCN